MKKSLTFFRFPTCNAIRIVIYFALSFSNGSLCAGAESNREWRKASNNNGGKLAADMKATARMAQNGEADWNQPFSGFVSDSRVGMVDYNHAVNILTKDAQTVKRKCRVALLRHWILSDAKTCKYIFFMPPFTLSSFDARLCPVLENEIIPRTNGDGADFKLKCNGGIWVKNWDDSVSPYYPTDLERESFWLIQNMN